MTIDKAPTTSKVIKKNGEARGQIDRDRVLSEATKMFLRVGYRGASLKGIAAELGVSAPALYWYFDSKEDLYINVIDAAMKSFVTYVKNSLTATAPEDQLDQLVRAHVTWQIDQSDAARTFDLSRAYSPEIPPERLESIRQMQIEYRDDLRLLLQTGKALDRFDFEDVKVTAATIITICEYVHTWYNPKGVLSSSEVAEHIVGIVQKIVKK